MRGRKPTPTALKVMRGNPGKRALSENEPKPAAGATAPDWLTPLAAQHWPTVARQLEDSGVLTVMDAPALALYCEAFARWAQATAHVLKHGQVITSPTGMQKQSPYLLIANKAHDQMAKMLVEFGMTPSSRSRVSRATPMTKNPFADLVKRRH